MVWYNKYAGGNPTSYLGHTLTWEKGRQLKTFGTNSYKYNNDGIRISKTVNGVEHKYVLDGTNIVKETWGSNTLIPFYDLDGTVCGLKYNGTAYYFYKNLQGDVIAITNDTGATIARYTYDAWGKCTVTSDTSGVGIAAINPFRYRSYYYDAEIGLYYLQSRYYDPNVGRFINADEQNVLLVGSNGYIYNLFSYCNNEPVKFVDNNGRLGILAIIAITGVIAAAVATGILCGYRWMTDLQKTKKYKKMIGGGKFLNSVIYFILGFFVGVISFVLTIVTGQMKLALIYSVGYLVVNGINTFMKGKIPTAKKLKDWLFKGYTNFMGGKIIKSLFSGGIAEAFWDVAEEELGEVS